jgi:hypothetical protein
MNRAPRVLGRNIATASVAIALALGVALAGVGRASGESGATAAERADISAAFGRFFTGEVSTSGAERFVQAGGPALVVSLDNAFDAFLMGFTQTGVAHGRPLASVSVRSVEPFGARVASVRFEFDIRYRYGVYRQTFTGAAVDIGGRWKVGWATACFVAEFYEALCPVMPRGAAMLPLPSAALPARFARPSAQGLIWPSALAVAPDASLLIVDRRRNQLLRRLPDGELQVVAGSGATGFAGDGGPATAAAFNGLSGVAVGADGTIYLADTGNRRVRAIAPDGTIRTVAAHLRCLNGLAVASDGELFVANCSAVVKIAPSGAISTFVADNTVTVGGHAERGFGAGPIALDDHGDLYAFSDGDKQIIEFSPSGEGLAAWPAYSDAMATAPGGGVLDADHFALLRRIAGGHASVLFDPSKTPIAGYTRPGAGGGVFQPDGVAAGPDGTIYMSTFVGNGYSDQTALAEIEPDGRARLLAVTTPVTSTLPALGAPGFAASLYPAPTPAPPGSGVTGCPAPTGLRVFDASARNEAIDTAKGIDTGFYQGLRRSDRAWWPGFYSDQIDGLYQGGRHAVVSVHPATGDVYAPAVIDACGASLIQHSIAIVVGPSDYSDQVSHLYFLDRNGHALLYWQHS